MWYLFLGNILKTENGGTTWATLHEPGGGLNSVHFSTQFPIPDMHVALMVQYGCLMMQA